ncbi:ribonucleotide-diphosphate reductase subunit beta [Pseudomonas helleri]|uniref:ribonucleotide-diphosphate reductase subunit beta n=1 Tax=Pseudomonas helleri TaxID=1608996 RepID=UPI00242B7D81|nr:ribonucleotide-diphosphate reductase subunit beta [Pseudomonas helleri]
MSHNIPRILIPKTTYTLTDYPEFVEMADKQNSVFWTHDEIKVEKDVQDILTNMTPAEKHGVLTVLKLFTLYEVEIGDEYWGGRVATTFKRPEIQRMASSFQFFELNVHAPFYNKINEALGLATDEFYSSYADDPVLNARMEFIGNALDNPDHLLSTAIFSMIEGAVLYSNFAFLKHFQSEGKNKLLNIVRGINFSVRDENLHSIAGAAIFKRLKAEMEALGMDTSYVEALIMAAADMIREHEFRIIDMIFEKGKIPGITDVQMKHFVESRINLCLRELGYNNRYEVKYNPISEWFYKGINNFQFNDFFSGMGNQYNRSWDESAFKFIRRNVNV